MAKSRNKKNIIKKKIEFIQNREARIKNKGIQTSKNRKNKEEPKNVKLLSTPTINIPQKSLNEIKNKTRFAKNKRDAKLERRIYGNGEVKKTRKEVLPPYYLDYGKYEKRKKVDYDLVICISSFDRYEKVRRLIGQFFNQKTKYNFKLIFLNDGSMETKYQYLKWEFPNIVYLENVFNGGKENYWKTLNKLWSEAAKLKSHAFLQIDDDFILCDNFLDILMDKFFSIKKIDNGYMALYFHIYTFYKDIDVDEGIWERNKQSIDGGVLYDTRFMDMIEYSIDPAPPAVKHHTSHSYVWTNMNKNIRKNGIKVFRMKKSLVWHDGNKDSKLNPSVRKLKGIYTKRFIDKKVNFDEK